LYTQEEPGIILSKLALLADQNCLSAFEASSDQQNRWQLCSGFLFIGMALKEAGQATMCRKHKSHLETVFNKPFFVNELLAAIRPDVITPGMFEAMVQESRAFDLNTILTAVTRQTDVTGLVPNLAGRYDDAQDVLEELMNLAHTQLMKIARLDGDLQTEIYATLKGTPQTTLRALLVLDEMQGEIIQHLLLLRQQSPLAMAIRQASERALRSLYHKPLDLVSAIFDGVIGYEDRLQLQQGEPRICYRKRVSEGAVVEVWQYFFMPKIDEIQPAEPFGHFTAGQVVQRITPHVFLRKLVDDSRFDPRTPVGYMGLIGKVGGAFPRLIAQQVKENAAHREQVMREQEVARVLYELFSR